MSQSHPQETDPGPEPDPESDPDTDADTDTDADEDQGGSSPGPDPDLDSDPDPDSAARTSGSLARARLDHLPHELLTLVLSHLVSLCRHPRDRHWTLTQLLCTSKSLYAHTMPRVWRCVSSSLWADCATGKWMCANDRARLLCRERDPVYAQLTDVVTMPLCDRYRVVDPDNLKYTTEYAFVFECACEVVGEHWHLGGPQEATSSSSSMTSSSEEAGSDSGSSDFEDDEQPPRGPSRMASSNTTFLAPVPRKSRSSRRRRRRRRRRHRRLDSGRPLGGYGDPSRSSSSSSPSSSSASSHDAPLPPTAVSAARLPPAFAHRLAHLSNLRRLTISSSSNVLDSSSMSAMGNALGAALLATHCRLTHLSIDISSHPGAFLSPLIPLASPYLRHLTLKFADASNSDQRQANLAADSMIRRAANLESLVISGREITIPLLSTIAASPRLGTLELHGEIVDMAGQRNFTSEFWPTASKPDLTSSTAPTSTSRPRSIHTLRLYLTGGHEPLLSTIYPSLHRPLTSLSWPVALASRVYASLVLNTQSFTLQCPHNSMYLHAILNDVSSSHVLTHLQLHAYAGGAAPRRALDNIRVLEFVDASARAVVALVSGGSVPNLGAVVVRATSVAREDAADGTCAVWAAVALLDARVTSRLLGVPLAHVAGLPAALASVHVEVSVAPGDALERVRAAVGFRAASVVPYVAEVGWVDVSEFVARVAGEGRARFPWVASAAAAAAAGTAQDEGEHAGRQVKVHVEYRERPHWTCDQSVTVVLDVRRSC